MRGTSYRLACIVGLALAACESPPPPITLGALGLESATTVRVDDGATLRFFTLTEAAPVAEVTSAHDVVSLEVTQQPARPPQRCTLAARTARAGDTIDITCEAYEVCAGLLAGSSEAIVAEPLFASLALPGSPMEIQPIPRSSASMLTFREGLVATVEDTGGEASVALDIADRVEFTIDDGLLSATLHPSYPAVTSLFALYVSAATPRTIRLSRFELAPDTSQYDSASEEILLEVAKVEGVDSHSGGTTRFGMDGALYASIGDGGFVVPPPPNAQDTSNVLGSMIRIGVDVPPGGGYLVPSDNPFAPAGVSPAMGRPEIYAWGLRNPFRWSFDAEDGSLWLADVGWDTWEEVNRIELGGNYGWPVMEGNDCLEPGCDAAAFVAPVYAHPHDLGSSSIIGGFVYHGNDLPGLDGAYLFTNFNRGVVSALLDARAVAEGADPIVRDVAMVDHNAVFLGPDARGEPLLVSLTGISRLRPSVDAASPLPATIAETGCMSLDDPSRAHGVFEPYEVNVALWADGADKGRYAMLPPGTSATVDAAGDLTVPVGTVLVKEFWRGDLRLETRFVVRVDDDRWSMATYRWEPSQRDAALVGAPTFADDETGAPWFFPSPVECVQCHTAAAGETLGLELAQLDRLVVVEGETVSQLDHWREIGWLPEALPDVAPLSTALGDDVSEEELARDYLAANCSNCHRPGTGLRVSLDLRHDVALADTGLCDAPGAETFGLDRVIEPGDPDASILVARMSETGSLRMPPIGRVSVDETAVAQVRAWIAGMSVCP